MAVILTGPPTSAAEMIAEQCIRPRRIPKDNAYKRREVGMLLSLLGISDFDKRKVAIDAILEHGLDLHLRTIVWAVRWARP